MEHFEIVSKLTLLPLQSSLSAQLQGGEGTCDLSTTNTTVKYNLHGKGFTYLGEVLTLKPSKIPLRLSYNYIKDSLDKIS